MEGISLIEVNGCEMPAEGGKWRIEVARRCLGSFATSLHARSLHVRSLLYSGGLVDGRLAILLLLSSLLVLKLNFVFWIGRQCKGLLLLLLVRAMLGSMHVFVYVAMGGHVIRRGASRRLSLE